VDLQAIPIASSNGLPSVASCNQTCNVERYVWNANRRVHIKQF